MPQLKSLYDQLSSLIELLDTEDLTEWEHGFVTNVSQFVVRSGGITTTLSAKQAEKIEQLYIKHFDS